MKRLFFAILAIASLVSCQKEELQEQDTAGTNKIRVITAYFDDARTKTDLDDNGKTPKWTVGDKILLLDENGKEEITLADDDIKGNEVTIKTTLSGTLYAVYPSEAAAAEKIVTENSVPVTLSASQDGSFGSANICVAKESSGTIIFKNVTAVLHITQTAAATKVKEITINAHSVNIAGTGTVDISSATPDLRLSSGESNKIKVKSDEARSDFYIAVAPATLPKATEFGFATGSELGGVKLSEGKNVAANTIYNIGSMDASDIAPNTYHPYVEINGLKWATDNLAITESGKREFKGTGHINGDYFQYAAYEDYGGPGTGYLIYTAFTSKACGDDSNGFTLFEGKDYFTGPTSATGKVKSDAPYYTLTETAHFYTKYNDFYSQVLDRTGTYSGHNDDAANAILGGSWRMPVIEELQALKNENYWVWDNGYGFYIFAPDANHPAGVHAETFPEDLNKSDALLFLPAAGSHGFYNVGTNCMYRSSTNQSSDNALIFHSGLWNSKLEFYLNASTFRYYGIPIRPVAD
ncbi:MAG: hypothetical protein MJZ17_00200 [Bacteroidales bacterium]|nr:hypothetical protein [Bacteroidales bacterium]